MKINVWIYVVIALFVMSAIWLYNRMVNLKRRAEGAWADIDVQLKRRHDLIPSLVNCVQGYVGHERNTLVQVTASRQSAQSSQGVEEKGVSETKLAENLKTLVLLAENYPDLKANATFLDLQKKLTETEDLIQYARRYYNAVVRDFNTMVGQFPNLLVAKVFNFKSLEFFQLDDQNDRAAQKVILK